jgi:hypothetical protein
MGHALADGIEHHRQVVVDDFQLRRRLCSGLPVLALAVASQNTQAWMSGGWHIVVVMVCFRSGSASCG